MAPYSQKTRFLYTSLALVPHFPPNSYFFSLMSPIIPSWLLMLTVLLPLQHPVLHFLGLIFSSSQNLTRLPCHFGSETRMQVQRSPVRTLRFLFCCILTVSHTFCLNYSCMCFSFLPGYKSLKAVFRHLTGKARKSV